MSVLAPEDGATRLMFRDVQRCSERCAICSSFFALSEGSLESCNQHLLKPSCSIYSSNSSSAEFGNLNLVLRERGMGKMGLTD